MLTIKVANKLERHGNSWYFRAKATDGITELNLSESVPMLRTDGMIKNAIIEKVLQIWQRGQPAKKPEKILATDDVFVENLNVSPIA
ncbi:MAG: hypothetical protein AMJ75_00265 [Phycisphaerae bacterium SM1_79]|nr:MAG: hypothetical protein AMJ75_00265 [Phycisphaerae bacterium SM1_79]